MSHFKLWRGFYRLRFSQATLFPSQCDHIEHSENYSPNSKPRIQVEANFLLLFNGEEEKRRKRTELFVCTSLFITTTDNECTIF